MTPHEIQLLYTFNDWANKRILQAASALTPEQFTKPLGNSFSSIRDTLVHMYGAEGVWLLRFRVEGPPPAFRIRRNSLTSPLSKRSGIPPELIS